MPRSHNSTKMNLLIGSLATLFALLGFLSSFVEAGQGCPFDDGSCRDYCSGQGCLMGYCGHFAWTQCICRKCGDEWNWYDKVRYNPNQAVNQTELDSLKLNASSPLILTASGDQPQRVPPTTATTTTKVRPEVAQTNRQNKANRSQQQQQQHTLTTLLIPDLSEGTKLDLNDIPDENSDKFLDYLAKNHEKLVQASRRHQQQQQQSSSGDDATDDDALVITTEGGDSDNEDAEQDNKQLAAGTPTPPPPAAYASGSSSSSPADEIAADDTVEIQISSTNNNNNNNNDDNNGQAQRQPPQLPRARLVSFK